MSIEYAAALIVGLPYSEFTDTDPLERWVDDEILERFSPEFDAPMEKCVYGLTYSHTFEYRPLQISLGELHELQSDFMEITGKWPQVILTLDVN